jgi:hypothetical protein
MVPTCGAIYHCLNIIIQILSVAHLRKACTAAEQGLIPVKNKHSYHNIFFIQKHISEGRTERQRAHRRRSRISLCGMSATMEDDAYDGPRKLRLDQMQKARRSQNRQSEVANPQQDFNSQDMKEDEV